MGSQVLRQPYLLVSKTTAVFSVLEFTAFELFSQCGHTELVINKRTGFPTEWKSTEDEIKTLPLKAKISLRRGMQQHVLITILVVEGRLEVVGKDIPRKIAQMIELKRKVADP